MSTDASRRRNKVWNEFNKLTDVAGSSTDTFSMVSCKHCASAAASRGTEVEPIIGRPRTMENHLKTCKEYAKFVYTSEAQSPSPSSSITMVATVPASSTSTVAPRDRKRKLNTLDAWVDQPLTAAQKVKVHRRQTWTDLDAGGVEAQERPKGDVICKEQDHSNRILLGPIGS
eukprot:GHVU01213082.1.p1 GENE.GHVU01213082.1~~GHVU01213082.1.p1  ORF type:complete len:172 (+),score=12.70 GHVU01213082.1:234-749(+)